MMIKLAGTNFTECEKQPAVYFTGGITVVPPHRLFAAIMVPTFFALRELRRQSLTVSGICAGE